MPARVVAFICCAGLLVGACTLSVEGRLDGSGSGASGGTGGQTGGATSTGGSSTGGGMTAGGGPGGVGVCDAGSECVPEPTVGTLVRFAADAASCPAGWNAATDLYDGVNPGCPLCTCKTAESGSCTPGDVTRYNDTICQSFRDGPTSVVDAQCVNIDAAVNQAAGYIVASPTVNEGSCPPNQVPAPLPVTPVGTSCELAASTSAGCESDEACVPIGSTIGGVCVLIDGVAACPNDYPNEAGLFAAADDQRACGCACGQPSGGGCAGATITLYGSTTCTIFYDVVLANNLCHDASGSPTHDSYLVEAGTWSGGSCQGDSGNSTVVFSGAKTLCCQSAISVAAQ